MGAASGRMVIVPSRFNAASHKGELQADHAAISSHLETTFGQVVTALDYRLKSLAQNHKSWDHMPKGVCS